MTPPFQRDRPRLGPRCTHDHHGSPCCTLVFALVVVVIGAVATLCGWDIKGWFSDLWDTMTSISLAALLGALTLKTVQTGAAAFAYYSILLWVAVLSVALAHRAREMELGGSQ